MYLWGVDTVRATRVVSIEKLYTAANAYALRLSYAVMCTML